VASVVVSPSGASVGVGASEQLIAVLKDASGQVLSGRAITWTSGTPSIVSVNGVGLVTGVAVGGPVTITASSEGRSGSAQVTVTSQVASVNISPAAVWLGPGQSQLLTATVRDAANNILTGRQVTWTSSGSGTASVSLAGVVTAGSAGGLVTITAASEGRSGTAQVSVVAQYGTSQANVTYCSPNGVDQKLDVFYPARSFTAAVPVIVYIHGGQLFAGDKASPPNTPAGEWKPVAANAGYVFVSINYRLGPVFKFPAMIEDAKCAIRYLRANATLHGIDPNRIGVTGTSSGGYLAALIGTTDASSGFEGNGGHAGVSSKVQAVVNEYGANMNLTLPAYSQAELQCRLDAYPQPPTPGIVFSGTVMNHVNAGDAPFLNVHGDHDLHANPAGSSDLHARLQAAGVPSTLVWVVNGGHGWHAAVSIYGPLSPTWPELLAMELAFFDKYLK
jgi:acetyl esterase/lipase